MMIVFFIKHTVNAFSIKINKNSEFNKSILYFLMNFTN